MNKLTLFLAHRMILKNAYKQGVSLMSAICFLGIFIGSFSLALITAIMNGFEVTIHEKMQGIHSHLIIQAPGHNLDYQAIASTLYKEYPTTIVALSPSATRYGIINTQSSHNDMPTVVIIKGIDPVAERTTTTLAHKIIKSFAAEKFSHLFVGNTIIIGKEFAQIHGLTVGDTLELLVPREQQAHTNKLAFDSYNAQVSGIFNTGIDEFDASVIYCSLEFLETLFPIVDVEQINIRLAPHTNENTLIQNLQERLNLSVFSWKKLYPALVATLTLEKYVSFFVLALIALVASMNIVSLLFMHITQKNTDIALLKSMGMTNNAISAIFFTISMSLSTIASLCGVLCACLISWILNHYPFITLPDTYYASHLPVAMNIYIIGAVLCVVLLFSFLATALAIQRIKSINISHVLRFEK